MKKEHTGNIKEFLEIDHMKFTYIFHWLELCHVALPRSWELQPLANPNSGTVGGLQGG